MEEYACDCVREMYCHSTFRLIVSYRSLTLDPTLIFFQFNFMGSYVWIDWSSMPQPSACKPDTPRKEREKMGADLGNAVKSIPAYVEKSDFLVVVAPGCLHADRRDPETKLRTKTCYRTLWLTANIPQRISRTNPSLI